MITRANFATYISPVALLEDEAKRRLFETLHEYNATMNIIDVVNDLIVLTGWADAGLAKQLTKQFNRSIVLEYCNDDDPQTFWVFKDGRADKVESYEVLSILNTKLDDVALVQAARFVKVLVDEVGEMFKKPKSKRTKNKVTASTKREWLAQMINELLSISKEVTEE